MLAFDANDWHVISEPKKFPLENIAEVQVFIQSEGVVALYGLQKKKRILLKNGSWIREKIQLKGFDAIEIVTNGHETTYRISEIDRRSEDLNNGEKVVSAPMPEPNNLLVQMRRIMREEMKRGQLPVLDPEDLPFSTRYEIDDDDEMFEEELYASQQEREGSNNTEDPLESSPEAAAPEARTVASEKTSDEQIAAE